MPMSFATVDRLSACQVKLTGEWLTLHLPSGYYRYYPSQSLWEVNPSFLRLLGCRSEEAFRALAPSVLASPSRREFWSGASLCGRSFSGMCSWPVAGGGERSMKEIIRGVDDTALGVFCWEGVLTPESALGRVPRQLAAAEFWSSFGRLSSKLFHHVDTPSRESVIAARAVAGFLKNWSDGSSSGQVLSALLAFITASVPARVSLDADLSGENVLLDTAPAELCGILLSLVHNALRSCGSTGRIGIFSHAEPLPDSRDQGLRVTVTDSGQGIPQDLRTHIRRPLFTTSGDGGTGLGLSAAAEIAYRRGGMLSIDASPSGGTAVTLRLPARSIHPAIASRPQSTPDEPRILVAHSDPEFAVSLCNRFSGIGVEADYVSDGSAAIEAISTRGKHYDVVVAELELPGVFGLELARLISRADPTARLLFLGQPATAQHLKVAPRFEVVSPNAHVQGLLHLIRRLRGEGQQAAGPVILVADDDPLVRGFIADAVSSVAGEILEAADGAEVLQLLQARSVDLLIVDLFMPEIEGLETIRSIRRNTDSLRILAISGAPDVFLKTARMLGADVILQKPVTPSALLSTIATLLGPMQTVNDTPSESVALP